MSPSGSNRSPYPCGTSQLSSSARWRPTVKALARSGDRREQKRLLQSLSLLTSYASSTNDETGRLRELTKRSPFCPSSRARLIVIEGTKFPIDLQADCHSRWRSLAMTDRVTASEIPNRRCETLCHPAFRIMETWTHTAPWLYDQATVRPRAQETRRPAASVF